MYNIDFYVDKLSFTPTDGEPFNDRSVTVSIEFGTVFSAFIKQSEFVYDIKNCLCELAQDFPPRYVGDTYNPALDSLEALFRLPEESSLNSIKVEEEDSVEVKGFHLNRLCAGVSFLVSTRTGDLVKQFEENPLFVSVWNSDTRCIRHCVGSAKLLWDSDIIEFVKNTILEDTVDQFITKNFILSLQCEDTAAEIGKLSLYIRVRVFGHGILTTFGDAIIDGKRLTAFKQNTHELCYTSQKFGRRDELDIGPIMIDEDLAAKYSNAPCPLEIFSDETRDKVKINDVIGPCRRRDCPAAVKIRAFLARQWAFKQMSKDGFAFEELQHAQDCGCCVCIAKRKSPCAPGDEIKNSEGDEPAITLPAADELPTCPLCGGVCESGKTCFENDLASDDNVPLLGSSPPCTCDTFIKPCGRPNCNCQQDIENERINFRHNPHCPKYTHKPTCLYGKKRIKKIWDDGHPPSINLTKCPVGVKCCLRQTPFKQILKNLPK